MVASNAARRAVTRSLGTPGGKVNGRPMTCQPKTSLKACLVFSSLAYSNTVGTSG